jgi:hypothetical protein
MKCPKCGFVSFDHLSECTKCGSDLRAVREGLGFSAFRSQVPSLLGSLLGQGRSDVTQGRGDKSAAGVGFEFETEAPEDPADVVKNFGRPPTAPAQDVKVPGAGMEETGIELSEAEFEEVPGMTEPRAGKESRDDR